MIKIRAPVMGDLDRGWSTTPLMIQMVVIITHAGCLWYGLFSIIWEKFFSEEQKKLREEREKQEAARKAVMAKMSRGLKKIKMMSRMGMGGPKIGAMFANKGAGGVSPFGGGRPKHEKEESVWHGPKTNFRAYVKAGHILALDCETDEDDTFELPSNTEAMEDTPAISSDQPQVVAPVPKAPFKATEDSSSEEDKEDEEVATSLEVKTADTDHSDEEETDGDSVEDEDTSSEEEETTSEEETSSEESD